MTREEQIEVATATYINGRLKNNVLPEEIEEIRLAYQAGAIEHQNPQNHWHDAQGDDLPPIDKEVIVLLDNGKVCFAHRPVYSYAGMNSNGDIEYFYPKHYDRGEWSIPNVKWWLDVAIPTEEGGEK